MTGRFVLVMALAIVTSAAVRQQPRDASRPASGTASIAGVVLVDGDSQRPARRVRVTLADSTRTVPGQTTTTDDRGMFAFRGLPAGRFELQAFKNAYLRASYGAARPDRTGTPIVVKDGEAITDLSIAIVRGGVITGSVRDDRDHPVPGLGVRVLRLGYNGVSGVRTLTPPGSGSVTSTDDRGEYRAYGLPPGSYLVLVPGPPAGRGYDPIRRVTSAEVRQALQAARSSASPVPGAPDAPPPMSSARVNHAPVFHPGVTDIGAAAVVTIGLGEERGGIDIAIQLVPTAKISGTITSSLGGLPAMLSVRLIPAGPQTDMLAAAGLRGVSTQVQPDGKYTFTGVAPGSYTVKALVGWGGRGATPTGPAYWASADVQAAGEDLSVDLTLQPGVPVTGRVIFEGSQPAPSELQSLSFSLVPPAAGFAPMPGGGHVGPDARFAFANVLPDAYRFATTWSAPGAAGKWTIKSSVANGREAFDAPLRVNANEAVEWTVTFTDTPATLTGALVNPGGRAATEYYILVFSADRSRWTPGSRRIRMTRPATDGTFTIRGLPPGEYFLAAPFDLETGEWNDPAMLDQLVKASVKVTLREGETTTQNYRMGGA